MARKSKPKQRVLRGEVVPKKRQRGKKRKKVIKAPGRKVSS